MSNTVGLANLTPQNVNLDNLYVPTQGAGNNGWMYVAEASAWSLALAWNGGTAGAGPSGIFHVQGTDDAVCQPVGTAVNAQPDSALIIYTLVDDQGVEMTFAPGGLAGQCLFRRERASGARWVRINYLGGASGCVAQITKLTFHATGMRDS
ncbi:MAG: hypothetical protein KGL39_06585 [Patescibacteria group bacterium]|nr:hypothetical protein [Patescibacteria group bacterium]